MRIKFFSGCKRHWNSITWNMLYFELAALCVRCRLDILLSKTLHQNIMFHPKFYFQMMIKKVALVVIFSLDIEHYLFEDYIQAIITVVGHRVTRCI